MAGRLLDEDPELAHKHALSAARKGGRIAVVRETLAITAYTVGDFALALRELRTFRRISGSNDQLPLMVDSERGVGRPDRALELGRSVPRDSLSAPVQVALAIAMSGARLDLGQPELALGELEIPQLDPDRAFSYSPPLYRAYAEVLDEIGRAEEASVWRKRAEIAEQALEPDEDLPEVDDETVQVLEIVDETAEREDGRDAEDGPVADSEAADEFEDAGEPEGEDSELDEDADDLEDDELDNEDGSPETEGIGLEQQTVEPDGGNAPQGDDPTAADEPVRLWDEGDDQLEASDDTQDAPSATRQDESDEDAPEAR